MKNKEDAAQSAEDTKIILVLLLPSNMITKLKKFVGWLVYIATAVLSGVIIGSLWNYFAT